MALRKSGIQLIVGNYSKFMSSIGNVNKAYTKMGKSATTAASKIQSLGVRVANASNLQANAMRRSEMAQIRLTRTQTLHQRRTDGMVATLNGLRAEYQKVTWIQKGFGGQTERLTQIQQQMDGVVDELNDSYQDVTMSMGAYENAEGNVEITTRNTEQAQAMLNEEMAAGTAAAGTATVAMATLAVAVVAIGVAIAAAVIAFRAFKKAMSLAVSAARTLWGWAKKLAEVVGGALKNAFSSVMSIGISDMINTVTSALRGLISELGMALSYFQRLDIQLETLTARDYAYEFGVPMSVAFKETAGEAQALLDWIRRIAVTTPFSVQNLAKTVAMANAMGLNIDMAKELTLATGDFTAAMGLEEEHMFRIIYNFGQMLSQGKLNGREFRDLANSFVPVWQIMAKMGEQAGMTAQEMKKLAFEGGVPVQAFFNEFINIASTSYPDAMEKMARTAQGVSNNIKDFLQTVVGMEMLGPTFDRFTAMAANALDKLLNPAVQRSAHLIGISLDLAVNQVTMSFNRVTGAIGNFFRSLGFAAPSAESFSQTLLNIGVILRRFGDRLVNFINDMSVKFAGSLEGWARNAGMWGYSIIAALASGMARAASLIVMVLTTIGRILSSWLVGASPPKIAPYIDKWGADMITEWTKGWLKADFSAFKQLADIVENYLRSISFTMGETALIPRILGSRKVIANLVSGIKAGFLSVAEAASRLISRVKGITDEFADYVVAMFAVVDATKALAVAEEAVAAATELVADQAERVAAAEKIVKEITKDLTVAQDILAAATARVRQEQEYLSEVMAGYDAILDDLNKQLRGVTEEYDDQQRLLKINQALSSGLLTAAEKERLEMEKRALELKDQIRDVEDQRDAEKALIGERIDALSAEEAIAQARVDEIEAIREAARAEVDARKEVQDALQEQVDALQRVADARQADIDALEEQLDATRSLLEEQIKQNDLIGEQIALLEKLAETGSSALSDLAEAFEDFSMAMGGVDEDPNAAVRAMAERILAQIKLAEMFEAAELNADTFFNVTLPGILDQFESNFMADFTGDMTALTEAWQPIVDMLAGKNRTAEWISGYGWVQGASPAEKLATALQDIAAALGPVDWKAISDAIVAIAQALADVDWRRVAEGVTTTKDAFKELGPEILAASLTGNPAAVGLAVGKFLDSIGSEMYRGVGEKPKWWEMVGVAIFDWIHGGSVTAIEKDTTLENAYKPKWKLVVGETRTEVMNDIIIPWMSEMFTTISTETGLTTADWKTKWEQAQTDFTTVKDAIVNTLIPDLTSTIWTMMSTTMSDVDIDWDEKWTNMKDYLANEVTTAVDTFRDTPLAKLATSLIDDLGGGIQNLIDDYWTPLKTKIDDTMTTVFDNFRTGPLASMKSAFDNLKSSIEKVFNFLGKVAEAITTFNLSKLAQLISMLGGGGRQHGGFVAKGGVYTVGERGRETFIPLETGLIMPNWWTEKVFAQPTHSTANSQATYIEVNPTYTNVQSEASIYYDVTAALAAARL